MCWPSTSAEPLSAGQETAVRSFPYQRHTVPSPTMVWAVRPVGRVRDVRVHPPSTQTLAERVLPSRAVVTVRE